MAKIVIDARIIRSTSGRYIERLLEHLQTADPHNAYIVLVRPAELDFWKPTASNFQLMAAPFGDFTVGEQWGLYRLLKKLQPDLVHFCMPQHTIFYRGRFVSTIHDLTMLDFTHRKWYEIYFTLRRAIFKRVFRRAVEKSEQVITPTNFVRDQLIKRFSIPADKVTVTYEAADRLASKPAVYKPLQGKSFIMYVGQVPPYKNLDRLVEAFGLLAPTYPELELVLIGKETDWHKRLGLRVEQLGVPRVHFTGFVSNEELAWLYKHAEAYVFPSLSEGFGLPALEAMVQGCPVLASSATCIPEVLGDAALYFDPASPEDIAELINRLLSDQSLRRRLVQAGPARARQFSWERMAKQTLAVYQKALR